jgi:hypothetical protein
MGLSESEYEALVRRMERFAEGAPRAYRRRVLLLAGVGYLYLFFLVMGIAVVIAIAAVALWHVPALLLKVLFVLGVLLVVVVRSLWVRLEPPKGEMVSRSEAPQLFALLDQLCARLAAPPVHAVIVTEELNAAVTQVPRLGSRASRRRQDNGTSVRWRASANCAAQRPSVSSSRAQTPGSSTHWLQKRSRR